MARRIIDQQLDDITRQIAHADSVLATSIGVDEAVALLSIKGLIEQKLAAYHSLSEWVLIIQPAEKT